LAFCKPAEKTQTTDDGGQTTVHQSVVHGRFIPACPFISSARIELWSLARGVISSRLALGERSVTNNSPIEILDWLDVKELSMRRCLIAGGLLERLGFGRPAEKQTGGALWFLAPSVNGSMNVYVG